MNVITAYCVRIFGDIFAPLDTEALDATVSICMHFRVESIAVPDQINNLKIEK